MDTIETALEVARERIIDEMRQRVTGTIAVTVEAHVSQGGLSRVSVISAVTSQQIPKRRG